MAWAPTFTTTAGRTAANVTVQGLTEGLGITLAVDGAVERRHFLVVGGASLMLQDLPPIGGDVRLAGFGYSGGVWSFGSFTARRGTFTGNHAELEGGAIQRWGGAPLLQLENATLAANTAAGNGSAIATAAKQRRVHGVKHEQHSRLRQQRRARR